MSSSTEVPAEISEEILTKPVPGVLIHVTDPRVPEIKFEATVGDLVEALLPLGLEITTKDAVNWASDYPGSAEAATRICELQQEIADLQHELGIATQAQGRKAAE